MIYIGIDTGVNTGVAVWCDESKELKTVFTTSILEAMQFVLKHLETDFALIIEDARKRKWYGNNAEAKKQGAGSIKRDCQIWEEFVLLYGIQDKTQFVPPIENFTKLDKDTFKRLTGWQARTNEHSRDAAMLVFKR